MQILKDLYGHMAHHEVSPFTKIPSHQGMPQPLLSHQVTFAQPTSGTNHLSLQLQPQGSLMKNFPYPQTGSYHLRQDYISVNESDYLVLPTNKPDNLKPNQEVTPSIKMGSVSNMFGVGLTTPGSDERFYYKKSMSSLAAEKNTSPGMMNMCSIVKKQTIPSDQAAKGLHIGTPDSGDASKNSKSSSNTSNSAFKKFRP
jgi:hypothetical protein